jgi:dephospho-CoA kinase
MPETRNILFAMLSPLLSDSRFRVYGLTGGIASGKSTVAQMFVNCSIPVVDADVLSRQAVAADSPIYAQLVAAVPSVFAEGSLNRRALGALLFSDPVVRKKVEALVHPEVSRLAGRALGVAAESVEHHTVIYDAALLIENEIYRRLHGVILVSVPPAIQLTRLMQRNQLTQSEAQARIDAQWPLEKKLPLANFVIHNEGTLEETRKQVEAIAAHILKGPK